MELGNLKIEDYLKKFKIRPEKTLFPPTAWDKKYWLMQKRCPLCQRKLKIDLKGNGRCVSVKKDGFFITKSKLEVIHR